MTHAGLLLPWWRWIFQLPIWQVVLVCLAITPFGLWAVRWVIQGKLVNPLKYEWMSFNFTAFLAVAVGPMLWLSYRMPASAGLHGHAYAWLNYGSILWWTAFAIFHMWRERGDVRTCDRRLGATAVYNFGVFVFFAPLFTVLFVNTWGASWTHSPLYFAAHLAPILAFAAWLWAGVSYDVKHRLTPQGQLKFVVTSPRDGWRNVRRIVQPVWEWLSASTCLSYELDALWCGDVVLNRRPFQGFVVLAMISPGMFFLINAVVYGEWLPLSYQWYSAVYGDLLLAAFGGVLLAMLAWADSANPIKTLFRHRIWDYLIVTFWLGFSFFHQWQERASVSLTQHLGAASLYHNFIVYPLVGYVLTILFVATMKFGSLIQRLLASITLLVFGGGWGWLADYDGRHQLAPTGLNKSEYTSPHDGWHNVRLLGEFLVHVFHSLF